MCPPLERAKKLIRFQQSSLRILFSLLRQLSNAMQSDEDAAALQFDVPLFQKIVRAVLLCPPPARSRTRQRKDSKPSVGSETSSDVRDLLLETWLNQYADIRWFFLRETA